MRILIVDDSAFMRNIIKNALKERNHEILEAASADEAVNVYREKKPNLVFMDVVLPGKTGIDALRAIKSIDNSANVVMCTSVGGQQKIIDESVQAGAKDFILKPFKSDDIIRVVTINEKKEG